MVKFLSLFLLFWAGFLLDGIAQNGQALQPDRKTIQIRPNSKDYVPVHRDNQHQRMDVKEKRIRMKQATLNGKMNKIHQKKATIKKKDNTRIMQRNNRTVINQQKMMMRRKMRR